MRRWLLASVIVLGLMHGIAFSAAYQMVARFANKNTISLGLGCVGSGLLALVLELILSVGPKPTRVSFIILFEVAAGATVRFCWDLHFQFVSPLRLHKITGRRRMHRHTVSSTELCLAIIAINCLRYYPSMLAATQLC